MPPDLIFAPEPFTALKPSKWSLKAPFLNLPGPDKLHETTPPMDPEFDCPE